MKPYDVAITKLRELGVDPEADADKLAKSEWKPVHVLRVRRCEDGRVALTGVLPFGYMEQFQGVLVPMQRLTFLIDLDLARDWGLAGEAKA